MYTVMIADDDNMVLNYLESYFPWHDLNCEIIGRANNGNEVYKLILEHDPDILILDIKMPGMDGIELVKKLRCNNIKTQIIIISGYAEFAYIQKLLKYEVLGYCLKPIEEEELIDLIRMAQLKIEENKKREFDNLLLDEIFVSSKKDEVIRLFKLKGLLTDAEKDKITPLISVGPRRIYFKGIKSFILSKTGINHWLYLLGPNISPHKIIMDFQLLPGVEGVGIGEPININEFLTSSQELYERLLRCAYMFFIIPDKKINFLNEMEKYIDEKLFAEVINELISSLTYKNTNLIVDLIDKVGFYFREGKFHISHALLLYNSLLSAYFGLNFVNERKEFVSSYDQIVSLFGNVYKMLENFKSWLTNAELLHGVKNDSGNIFQQVVSYVNANFSHNISLMDIAKKFYLSPNYISQLFKKKLNKTFSEYLTNLRINRACELLLNTNLTINEIAERVGYTDYLYFRRVFKKKIGLTPTEFRRKMRD